MRIVLERTDDGWSYDVLTTSGLLFKRATGLKSPWKALECCALQIHFELDNGVYSLALVRPDQPMVRITYHRIGWGYAVHDESKPSFYGAEGFLCAGRALEAYLVEHDAKDVCRLEFTDVRLGAP